MSHCCRHCGSPLEHEVIDLGHQPPSNAYLTKEQLSLPEQTYPLKVFVCTNCWLVQLPAHASANELFTADYAYFSSTSKSWCDHARNFVSLAVDRLGLGTESFVVELASNDGYLLQYVQQKNIPCLGIEPTQSTANASRAKGIQTLEAFFGSELGAQLEKADLVIANNVLAHVPDINDFIQGISNLLKPSGQASVEFPHLLRLIQGNQFDTIYHEHYSYLSLGFLSRICKSFSLEIVDVEKLSTHGGSLRVWIAHPGKFEVASSVVSLLEEETAYGLQDKSAYIGFQNKAHKCKISLLSFLIDANKSGTKVLGYGAAAKGNTLLNYCGVNDDLLPMVADQALSKQGKYLPGSHIPVVSPHALKSAKPDQLLLLPWNLINEISQMYPTTPLITAIPDLVKHF